MSEHLIKALENQRNAAMNEAAIHAAREMQFEQAAKTLQAQNDALNEQLGKLAGAPSAEVIEEAKAKHGHRGRQRKVVNGLADDVKVVTVDIRAAEPERTSRDE